MWYISFKSDFSLFLEETKLNQKLLEGKRSKRTEKKRERRQKRKITTSSGAESSSKFREKYNFLSVCVPSPDS